MAMITQECDIWVINKGWTSPSDLTLGDSVYTLDGLSVVKERVTALSSDFVNGRINRIDSGPHNVDVTEDTLMLYYSTLLGLKYIKWNQIPLVTANKEYKDNKYQPVLSYPNFDERVVDDIELESIARRVAIHEYDRNALESVMDRLSCSDAQVLIDMLEFWCSESPGKGWFDRVSVKSRTHRVFDKYYLDQLSLAAVLAGYTCMTTVYEPYRYALKVNYSSMPIPGSRPKNEKYYKTFYAGLMYNIDAGNKPILGKSRDRCFYLPTTSTLQKGEIKWL